jgi:hypothetical protein
MQVPRTVFHLYRTFFPFMTKLNFRFPSDSNACGLIFSLAENNRDLPVKLNDVIHLNYTVGSCRMHSMQ